MEEWSKLKFKFVVLYNGYDSYFKCKMLLISVLSKQQLFTSFDLEILILSLEKWAQG